MQRGTTPAITGHAQHVFAHAPQANIPRSSFDRSHGHKTTFNEGYLYPILVDEALPGDTFNLSFTLFARLATPIYPIMDNLYLETFFFAVPYRLVWENWEQFNGANIPDTNSSTDYTIPQVTATGGVLTGDLADYMGLPTQIDDLTFDSLHLRAYNLIWNEWFRDENMQNEVTVEIDNGPDTYSNYVLLQRGKRYDYFTSCLPFPQKGTAVSIPLGTSAPVVSSGTGIPTFNVGGLTNTDLNSGAMGTNAALWGAATTSGTSAAVWNTPNLSVDLSDATAASIDALRLAFQTQKMYERDARGGTRYTEIVYSHFGVVSPDSRLQRPEYLGGGSTPVLLNPVAQTAQATTPTDTNALGNLGAFGTCAAHGHGFVHSFVEHCLVIGLVSVRADLNYQQGMSRMWSRQARFDFYWPAFACLGEQAVLNKEIYAQGSGVDNEVFGYQEAWAEYRYKPSLITGEFRSNASSSLDAWHLAQDFASLPTLSSQFIVEDAPMSRILAVSSAPHFILDCYFKYHCARPMPVYSVPGLVDHF